MICISQTNIFLESFLNIIKYIFNFMQNFKRIFINLDLIDLHECINIIYFCYKNMLNNFYFSFRQFKFPFQSSRIK